MGGSRPWRLVCSLVFAAFGLFMGYLLPTENVMQILGPALMLLSFLGGLFIPFSQFAPLLQTVATFTPLFGVAELSRAPLTGDCPGRRGQRGGLAGRVRRAARRGGSAGTRPASEPGRDYGDQP